MMGKDRQRLKILAILLAVLASTLWIGEQINPTPGASTAQTPGSAPTPPVPTTGLSEIEVTGGWMIGLGEGAGDPVRRNPFEYGPEALPPASETPLPGEPGGDFPAAVPSPAPQAEPPPPPPPPIPFKYNGYAVIDAERGRIRAFLFEEDKLFSVSENEVLMGRYRVNQVTETFVEVEDLEFGRRQRLPLIVQ